uniref:SAP domain-containing protein n=1 Tax=Graphocephala atropunctata TaxID=36148 RepID=A0A1B6KR51_9HEMI
MKVHDLREELEARSLSTKGLKSQLSARLAKALKTEQDKEEESNGAKGDATKNETEKPDNKNEKEEKDEDKNKKEEEEKKKLDEKEKQLLEKRYTLPEKSHILVHPSRTAKSGKFDCTVMSLSLLLDYRPEDSKEHSFEVSLFAELFNEMLMRDFGFHIYKALVEVPEKPKEEKEEKDKSKDKEKEKDKKSDKDKSSHSDKKEDKKDDKKDDKNSIEDDDGSGDEEDSKKEKKDTDKKKKERVKLVTMDPYLLLSFVYFDQTHCGYIFDKDIEELLFTLGLNLSRAQVKKLVQKVVSRDSLHYRKLTDKAKDDPSAKQNGAQTIDDLMTLALGNKRLFPIFEEAGTVSKRPKKGVEKKNENPDLPSGFVMFNGSLLDINKLQSQFKRSEDTRVKTEKLLEKLRSDNTNLKETTNRNVATIKKLNNELKDFKERLTNTNSELCNMDSKTKLYFSTMAEIYEKLGPILVHKPTLKDEIIEDVEMEDAMENTNFENKQSVKLQGLEKNVALVEKEVEVKIASEQNPNSLKIEAQQTEVKARTETKCDNVPKENIVTDDKVKENTDVNASKQEDKKPGNLETKSEIKTENLNQLESKAEEVDVEKTLSTPEPKKETKLTAHPSRSSPRQTIVKTESQTKGMVTPQTETPQSEDDSAKEKSLDTKQATEVPKVDENSSLETTTDESKPEEKPSPTVRTTRSRESKTEDKKTPVKK